MKEIINILNFVVLFDNLPQVTFSISPQLVDKTVILYHDITVKYIQYITLGESFPLSDIYFVLQSQN